MMRCENYMYIFDMMKDSMSRIRGSEVNEALLMALDLGTWRASSRCSLGLNTFFSC